MSRHRFLILPDIHHRIDIADQIAEQERPDAVYCLGDYQDDFGDTVSLARSTARWMKEKLDQGWILLWGNHDLPYAFPQPGLSCPGHTKEKEQAVNLELTGTDWLKLRFWTYCGPFLLSHAGFSHHWLHPMFGLDQEYLNDLSDEVYQSLLGAGTPDIISWCSQGSGGSHPWSGPMWMRWHELRPIEGIHQIVGHTGHTNIRVKKGSGSDNYCLDTHSKHYMIVEEIDGRYSLEAKAVDRLNERTVHVINDSGSAVRQGGKRGFC